MFLLSLGPVAPVKGNDEILGLVVFTQLKVCVQLGE